MQAIILASGMGRDLDEADRTQPKALLDLGGRSLLDHLLDDLADLGVQSVVVTTGYLGDRIEAALEGRADVQSVHNERYDLGSTLSLHQAMTRIRDDDDLLLLRADVYCQRGILRRLVDEPGGSQLLLDRDSGTRSDPIRVFVQQGKIVELRRGVRSLQHWTIEGNCVGWFRFCGRAVKSLRDVVKEYVMRGEADRSHEEVIRDLALSDFNFFGVIDITGQPWIEIGTSADLRQAREMTPANVPAAS